MSSSEEDISDEELRRQGWGRQNRQKKTKEELKEDALYGVFKSKDDQPRKTDSYGTLRYAPMTFASASSASNAGGDGNEISAETEKAEESKPKSRFQFMSFSSASSLGDSNNTKDGGDSPSPSKPTLGMRSAFANPMLDDYPQPPSNNNPKPNLTGMAFTRGPTFTSSTSNNTPKSKNTKQSNQLANGHEAVYGIGAKLLGQMGYVQGKGLGRDGKGILKPIEHKLRPQGLGLGGIKEKTKQSIEEAKRRGENVSDDEEEHVKSGTGRKGLSGSKKSMSQAERTRKKAKNLYKTVHDMEKDGLHIPSGFKKIIDMTKAGQEKKSEDQNDILGLVETSDEDGLTMQQRELIDQANNDMEKYSSEWRTLKTRKAYAQFEVTRLEKDIDSLAEEIQSLEEFLKKCTEFQELSNDKKNDANGDNEPENDIIEIDMDNENTNTTPIENLKQVTDTLSTLQYQFSKHIKTFRLDELAVATLAPLLQTAMESWSPFHDPTLFKDDLAKLKPLFGVSQQSDFEDDKSFKHEDGILGHSDSDSDSQHNLNHDYYDELLGKKGGRASNIHNNLSLYERLLGHTWLPKVTKTLQEEWNPEHASSAILLLEEWGSILPPFIKDEIYNKTIVPKLIRAIKKWRPESYYDDSNSSSSKKKKTPAPHTWIFPWLQYLSQTNIVRIVREIKSRYMHLIKDWRPSDVSPIEGLAEWREIIRNEEFDDLVQTSVVPRLSKIISNYVKINSSFPTVLSRSSSSSSMKPADVMTTLFKWCPSVVKPSVFGEILISSFFPKWEAYLYDWLLDEPDMGSEDEKSNNKQRKVTEYTEEDEDRELDIMIAAKVDLEIILSWYEDWYNLFPEVITEVPAVLKEFHISIDMIDEAADILPVFRVTRLPKPKLVVDMEEGSSKSEARNGLRHNDTSKTNVNDLEDKMLSTDLNKNGFGTDATSELLKKKKRISLNLNPSISSRPAHEINAPATAFSSFREVVEEACSELDLFLIPANQAHLILGHPLYKISENLNGAGGMPCYFDDNVLWAKLKPAKKTAGKKEVYEPISLNDIKNMYDNYKSQ